MARSLTVAEYGQWGLLFAIQTGLATFGLVGIFEAVVGLMRQCGGSDERSKLFAAANGVFVFTIGVSIAIAFVGGIFALGLDIDVISLASVIFSGGLLAFAGLQAQLIRLEERHIASLSFSFLVPAVSVVASAIAFFTWHTTESFFLGSFVGLLLTVVALWISGLPSTNGHGQEPIYRHQIFARLIPYVAVAFFGWMSGYGNNLIINGVFEKAEVARFTFAMSIGAILQLVASALNQVWSPRFFRIIHVESIELVEEKNRKFFMAQSLIMGLIAMVGIIISSSLLRAVGGNLRYYSSMQVEYFLLFSGYIVLIPWWHCSNYYLAFDRGRNLMNIVIATSAAGVSLWVMLIWLLGPLGVYVGFFTQMLLRSIGIAVVSRGLWPLRLSWGGPVLGISLAGVGLLLTKI